MNAETIGLCAWCGLLDHHLIHGSCAACLTHIKEIGFDDEHQPLGADMGVFIEEFEKLAGPVPAES